MTGDGIILTNAGAYNPELHEYRKHTGRLPGATDVVKSEGLIATDYMSEDAKWRGKCVHRGLELLNTNELDWDTVNPMIAGYLHSHEKFIKETGFQVLGCEQPCFDDAFGCMPDVWGMMNGFGAVVEYKTGVVPKWTAIQTALQKRAIKKQFGFNAVKRFGLRLMADGSLAKLDRFDNPDDEYVAMSMVASFHWKLQHGYIRDWN